MKTKTYMAETMAEAVAEVKQDLGRDAMILKTRRRRKGGLLGLGGRAMWEITASGCLNVPRCITNGRYVPVGPAASEKLDRSKILSTDVSTGQPVGALTQQVGEIRYLLEQVLSGNDGGSLADIPLKLQRPYSHLLRQDLSKEVAVELVRELQNTLSADELADDHIVQDKLAEMIAGRIKTPEGGLEAPASDMPRVIAMIGPTGVGKTTTIAKMAANYRLRENRRVGLITIDTYRIAAVDQLKTYAEIIEVPLKTVLTAGELHQAVHSMKDLDVVLIDTAGRSPSDQDRLNQLRTFLVAAQADEVALVISATANRSCAIKAMERFMPLGANRLVVTKLDEAETFGVILTIADAGKAPLSYVTTGQDVPDDIEPADPRQLAEKIVTGVYGEG